MIENQTICAVVVTYNRKDLLLECLDALINQTRKLDAIYIIDNFSNDGTEELLYENKYLINNPPTNPTAIWETENSKDKITIHYVKMNQNTGGAGGFYEGVKRSYEKGYDWLWIMDDDVQMIPSTLQKLLESAESSKLFAVGPTVIYTNNTKYLFYPFPNMESDKYFKKYGNNTIIKNTIPPFNGTIYNRSVIEKVGFPDKNLFIWGDEDDFGYRVMQQFNAGVSTSAICYHPQLFYPKYAFIGKRKFNYFLNPTWKVYYKIRNLTYLRLYKKQKRGFSIIKMYLKNIYIDIIFRKENKFLSCYYHTKALFDALFKKLGRRIDFIK